MSDIVEIYFDERGVVRRENLFRIFWLWDVIWGGSGYREKRIEWQAVSAVYVYKLDAFTFDVISLAVRTIDDDAFELDERMSGWQELAENLPNYLPGCLAFHEWYMNVAFPAFEMNLVQIYPQEK